ncbi:DUF2198 family protein [Macrococcus hajekii]|uniref:DUF2198 family protein n=1 Tax=Macrococcus hajekii TaxID=198482 RepID=A0A4R6BIU7_9STAP|nr:DUF2198 family protein [Macrococcus hajekii]TDM01466.1 DUF2198 family protein [Macrococcus hajekii]GGB00215.1 hypothetical protein GCM10007190_05340 [Macrococcus hajekii]
MIWYVLASFLPAVMVMIFSMIVKNKYTGLMLATIVIGVSVYKGFFHSEMIVFLDTISLILGYFAVDQLKLHH